MREKKVLFATEIKQKISIVICDTLCQSLYMTASKTPDQRRMQYPEQDRSAIENPRIITLLGSAGLTAVDLQLFDRLYQQGFETFVHGSIMADRIKPTSDIDFTVIGDFKEMPADLRDTLMPGYTAIRGLRMIDYVSTSVRSQDGRKISMHISEPDFRETHPILEKPFATEYRPGIHAKSGPRSYFLSGATHEGDIRLLNILCESESVGVDGSTVTDIPQTGKLIIKGDSILIDGHEKPNMKAQDVIRLHLDGTSDESRQEYAEEVMILGLEFDKMSSDTPMYHNPDAEQRLVQGPAARSMEALGLYTQTDPAVITNRLFSELARHWSKIKPHKAR